ncbi:cupin-like domain-containing protein [Aurantiacibacter sp. MUD11]|uniref:cupin-like domain-containing protein n=1 Tax=Aurantiacibacter sp. MUD11 TaxID=3003265 RepID=UPI0022AA8665|nr:cupin-like domain-containing protein [Aurantiacibacter sp. MUD11]WAT18840.1 cupin-like domain-containing protein [Aurantiacibacter sp. MUD11]
MSHHVGQLHGRSVGARQIFPARSRAYFASSYPEGAHKLEHDLIAHPLLELDALAELGEQLPDSSIEYNRGDLPIGVDGKPEGTGLTIGETIRNIDQANSWAVLKNIEQSPAYAALLGELLEEMREVIEPRTGKVLSPQGFIFVSSPDAVTPFHFDPEHNILLQLRGTKSMTLFPAGCQHFASDLVHESYHTGGGRELKWDESFAEHGITFQLEPGDAIYVPVMAPHYVRNGPQPSISLSITWRSEWSYAEADARAFNALLRKFGINPRPPKRWPAGNKAKAIAMRIARRIPGLG